MNCEESTKQTDAELARRAAEGDETAFEEIHRRYRRPVYALALRMTRNAADAEDLTQESFLSVLRHVGSFRGEAAFSSWLYRLAVNVVRMHFRRRGSRPEDLTDDGELCERKLGVARRAGSPSVFDRIAIDRAVKALPPGYRATFVLHDVAGYEHAEIARMRGCSTGNSKAQLHRARVSLRSLLSARAPAPALQA
ncbi:MAG: sigma-70 family RNA polymerase sigma factor [Acidobacteria bacterium]|nr:sigma-70 family RNA polymerase sigma factor [Acidobacteriota bacterium]